tara:strand:- start:2086 stop:2889 length:804 start_codon:yes stop_codon:yes gene_type:complete
MNYQKHYDLLIERAKNRKKLKGYVEKHHVLPKCLGGNDDLSNIVELTPEEHYVAHQLLVKIYKGCESYSKLLYAANMMTVNGRGQYRNNKSYGWLRREFSNNHHCKKQETRDKISRGIRKTNSTKLTLARKCDVSFCLQCGVVIRRGMRKFCSPYCYSIHPTSLQKEKKHSNTMKKNLASMSDEEMKIRMKNSFLNITDEEKIKRGRAISKTKRNEKNKVLLMDDNSFYNWVSKMKLYNKTGRRNSNVVRVLQYRGVDVDEYYNSRV